MLNILNIIADQFVFWNLKQISHGYLNLIDARGKQHFFEVLGDIIFFIQRNFIFQIFFEKYPIFT